MSTAAQEAIWLQQLTSDLMNESIQEMMIHEDNQSTICLEKNQQVHGRTKHIVIKYHFIHDLVEVGRIKVEYCASENMIANILIKGLHINRFDMFQQLSGIVEGTCTD